MSGLLESERLATLAREESVRGLLVRNAIEAARGVEGAERRVVEDALQLLLDKFGAGGGEEAS